MSYRSVGLVMFTGAVLFLGLRSTAYPDTVWTKSFNYSGKVIAEDLEYVTIQTADGIKKIPRKKIEDITYSEKAALPPEEKAKIQTAEQSKQKAVQDQLKWQKEHPREYAQQQRELEEQARREEQEQQKQQAEEERRLKKLDEEMAREEAELERKIQQEIEARQQEEEARRQALKAESQGSAPEGQTQPGDERKGEWAVESSPPGETQ